MTLRSEAVAAHAAEQAENTTAARARLAEVLAPYDVAALDVAAVDAPRHGRYRLVVFTDGDVHLGVRETTGGDGWETYLLADPEDSSGWTQLAKVENLAGLGAIVDELDPPEQTGTAPAWVQPTGAHDAYDKGDRVTHGGKLWQSTTAGNVWEPGVSGWREVVA